MIQYQVSKCISQCQCTGYLSCLICDSLPRYIRNVLSRSGFKGWKKSVTQNKWNRRATNRHPAASSSDRTGINPFTSLCTRDLKPPHCNVNVSFNEINTARYNSQTNIRESSPPRRVVKKVNFWRFILPHNVDTLPHSRISAHAHDRT